MRSFSVVSSLPRSLVLVALASAAVGAISCADDGTGSNDTDTGLTMGSSSTSSSGSTTQTGTTSTSTASNTGTAQPTQTSTQSTGSSTGTTTSTSGTGTSTSTGTGGAGGAGGAGGEMPGAGGAGGSMDGAGGSMGGDGMGGAGGEMMGGDGGAMGGDGGAMGGDGMGGMGGEIMGGDGGGGDIREFVENPGQSCDVGAMPSVDSLMANPKLPDPFMKMDGTRITDKSEWLCRREEILQQGYEFMYGNKPIPPEGAVTGSVSNNSISVSVEDGGSTQFSVSVSLPSSGTAPYPAVIAYGSNAFSNQLSALGIASITYDVGDVAVESGGMGPKSGGFYSVYGADHEAGMLVAWAWGVSRIIDVLEQDPSVIDPAKIGVTGCSRWGKGAFVAGVLDNRVALTVPVESGVGGTPALRLIGDLDSGGEWPYHAISYVRWFSEVKLGVFATANNAGGDTTDRLPVDIHEMIGLVAPRGLYIVDNPSTNYAGLDRNTAWVTANAGAKIYEALGVGDNITLQGASGGHCQWRQQYTGPLEANLKKFLLGDDSAATGTFDTDFNGPNPEDHYDWDVPTLAGEL